MKQHFNFRIIITYIIKKTIRKYSKMYKRKIVVAYSGGLDTSVMVKWLSKNYDAEIISRSLKSPLRSNFDF